MTSFIRNERDAQSAYLVNHLPGGVAGYGGSSYRLSLQNRALNLAPGIRDDASAYFTAHGITWHQHANHALSSQVSCLTCGRAPSAGRAIRQTRRNARDLWFGRPREPCPAAPACWSARSARTLLAPHWKW